MGDQINYNNIGYNKFNKISDMVSPKKKQSACKIINLVKVYKKGKLGKSIPTTI